MKKRLLAAATALLLAVGCLAPLSAGAAELTAPEGETAARALYGMGLFRGKDPLPDGSPDFALNSQATRGEAITMLVRLLGAEEEAVTRSYAHPFTDAGWADPYVGYAYARGITSGTGDGTTFGTYTIIDAAQFVTLVLRALGHSEVDWQSPWALADAVGLEYVTGDLERGDMAWICYSALFCTLEGTQDSLYRTLVDRGAVEGPCPGRELPSSRPMVTAIRANSTEELAAGLAAVNAGRTLGQVTIAVPAGQEQAYVDFMEQESFNICGEFAGFSCIIYSGQIRVQFGYRSAVQCIAYLEGKLTQLEEKDAATLEKALEIVDSVVDDTMSDYQKAKALHDYLGDNTSYSMASEYDDSFSASGPLLEGVGVCGGYTDAYHLLCYLAGLECIQVGGTANGGDGWDSHAWNKVKVDGRWYNVDVTYDDPIYVNSDKSEVRHDYFLVSDETLAKDHRWTAYPSAPQAPEDH